MKRLDFLVPYSAEILLCLVEFLVKERKRLISYREIRKRIGGIRQNFYSRCKILNKKDYILIFKTSREIYYLITEKGIKRVIEFFKKYPFMSLVIQFFQKNPSMNNLDLGKYSEFIIEQNEVEREFLIKTHLKTSNKIKS